MTVFDLNNLKPNQQAQTEKPLVLLADDCPRSLKLMGKLLSKDFEVITADSHDNALEAIEALDTKQWLKVAVIERQISPSNTLLTQIQSLNADTVGIELCSALCSANLNEQNRVYRVINKPMDPAILLQTVHEAVAIYQKRREMLKQADGLTQDIQVLSESLAEKKLQLDRLMDDLSKLG